MQKFEIDKQVEAINKLHARVTNLNMSDEIPSKCFSIAISTWPVDYAMQLYEFEKQLEAAIQFFNFEDARIPDKILEAIRIRAFQEWRDDFSMMLYEQTNQIESWLAINL